MKTLFSDSNPKQLEPWYNEFGGNLPADEPFFFNPEEYPWVKEIESQWMVIHDELASLLREHEEKLTPYFKDSQVSHPGRWKVFPFFYWRWQLRNNCRKCPETVRLLKSIPQVTTGAFSVLEPDCSIKPHTGDTNAVVRCHLGLIIPGSLPDCGIKVGSEEKSWQEGKFLIFSDAHWHTAWNHTDKRRFILFVDVVRPEFAWQTNRICRKILFTVVLQFLEMKLPLISRYRVWLKKLFLPILNLKIFL